MRFERLRIPAFGPFTSLDVAFPRKTSDFHVIYGANEAGKSSLLRAFRDLLFGIHSQSPDNFIHDYKDLRIHAEIRSAAGQHLSFQRRKGNKNTLLDIDGGPLTDDALTPFLGSVDAAYFSTMFGLGARELREGAEDLLRGRGDLGEALFSASMGGTPVQHVMAALTEASDRLFKGRATTHVSIRPGVARYKELLRQCREAAINPEAWDAIAQEISDAEMRKKNLESELLQMNLDLEWMTRCEDALPTAGRLMEEIKRLGDLSGLPPLAGDFVDRVRTARKGADEVRSEMIRLRAHIARLEAQLAACRIAPGVLDGADVLEALHRDLSVYRDRRKSLSHLDIELAGIESGLRSGMRNLGLTGDYSELESLRLGSAARLDCEEAAAVLQNARDEKEKHLEKAADLKAQMAAMEAQLAALPEMDLSPLRDALAAAAGATDAAKTLPESESTVRELLRETGDLHRQLSGAPENPEEAAGLRVPSRSTIRRFQEEMNRIQQETEAGSSRIREGLQRIESFQAELGRLERRGQLPTEEALQQARAHRDYGWHLVLSEWKGPGAAEEWVPGMPLEEAFPRAVAKADLIADQLREQAEAVAQAEEKRFQIGRAEKEIQDAQAAVRALEDRMDACRAEWAALWESCGVRPRTPLEMLEWRDAWQEFKGYLRQLRVAEESLRRKKDLVRQAEADLAVAVCEPADKGFAVLYSKALRQVRHQEQASGRRIEIQEQLRKLKNQMETLEQNVIRTEAACRAASAEWSSRCRRIGLPPDISPGAGVQLLRERADILAGFDVWKKMSTERQKTLEAIRRYEKDASEACRLLGIQGDTTDAQVLRMWAELTGAREARTRCEHLTAQIQEAAEDLKDLEASHAQAVQSLDALARMAGRDTVDALEPLLADLELRDRTRCLIAGYRDTLGGLARGQTVDTFLDRIRSEDVETLSQRKAVLLGRKTETESALQAVRDAMAGLRSRKQALEAAGDTAADLRQQAETVAARLKQDAARFIRLRLAVHYLQIQIERFRKENQGPLLEKSGRVFSAITRGAFAGLGAEFNADDIPVLVGLRPEGTKVPISGMSDGSRDQLYLSLRLAALDRYLESHEPMPLILDDLLITFDDDRAVAILPELAGLARRTQVFLFTHHDHLVELCRRNLDSGEFHLHRLGG